jgi:hypothetical protein
MSQRLDGQQVELWANPCCEDMQRYLRIGEKHYQYIDLHEFESATRCLSFILLQVQREETSQEKALRLKGVCQFQGASCCGT